MPAITTHGFKNHTVRTQNWRYISYAGGGEELYHHLKDPNEWTNLADDPEYADVKKRLKKHLPKTNKPSPKKTSGKNAGK